MSVFTAVSRSQLAGFLSLYHAGELSDYQGIEAGVENSNFFVNTTAGCYVLTLFEKHNAGELNYFLMLMAHLSKADVPVARPLIAKNGQTLLELNGKPAALMMRLSGQSVTQVSLAQCAHASAMLARIHLAAADCCVFRAPDRGYDWRQWAAVQVQPHLSAEQARYLQREVKQQQLEYHAASLLPGGPIHGDLFRDNALFTGSFLTGVLDWYYACNDSWLYDLAVFVNDWCCHDNGALNKAYLQTCLQAYHKERPLLAEEKPYFLSLLRAAASRFWLSRLLDVLSPRPGTLVLQKDPQEFFDKLCYRFDEHDLVQMCWPLSD